MKHMPIAKKIANLSSIQSMVSLKGKVPWWYILGMGGVLLVSLFLNFFRLGQDGYGNLYYAAAIKSMLMNWHNFFFVSFDPGGFVSVDKPPLSFWLQVGCAYLFGLSPWSTLLPQALAGVLSVPLLAHLVRRTFGPLAGLLAAAALAVTPINVVTSRNLTMDSLLVFVLLLAIWAAMRAVETGRLRLLLLCFLLVGIGFNIKMLDAYLVLPALLLFYWFSAPYTQRVRLLHLILGLVVLLFVSFCWIAIVDLTPASLRPFVGSSATNSELQLALFYNGGERVFGNLHELSLVPSLKAMKIVDNLPAFARPDFILGDPGLLRLITMPLGAQIGWLIPLAILGLIGVKWDKPSFWPLNKQQQGLALWGVWFLTQFIFFSAAPFTHQHYVVQMAPSIAALLGMGIVTTLREMAYRRWYLPLALLVTALMQVVMLSTYITDWEGWLIPLVLIGAISAVLLARPFQRGRSVILAVALCAMLVAPTVWAAIPVLADRNDAFPYAGPTIVASSLEDAVLQSNQDLLPDNALMSYLLKHQGKTQYLAATVSSYQAAPMIQGTGKAVMALGGYAGGDQILSLVQLKALIANGTVRYFVFPQTLQEAHISPALKAYQTNYQNLLDTTGLGNIDPLTSWVRVHCHSVPTRIWHPSNTVTLLDVYDCA